MPDTPAFSGVSPQAPALPSPEFGLAIGHLLGRFAFGTDDLHYGYWPDELEVTPRNLGLAQARYTEELIRDIPDGVRRILDVGCGTGATAARLAARGFAVDAVSPNPWFTTLARERLPAGTVHHSRFEDLEVGETWDLLLFSESLLFMRLEPALQRAERLLKPGGYLLISDLFRLPSGEKSPIGGGQDLRRFEALMAASPFQLLRDTDITDRIAPTFDLLQQAYDEAIEPAYRLLMARLDTTHPWLMRLVRWRYGRRLRRYEEKHFSRRRDAGHFLRHKSYRRLLYRLDR